MIKEEQMMTLFKEVNPVPNVDSVDVIEVDATRYLATLSRRSSEVNHLTEVSGTAETEQLKKGWVSRFGPVLMAAIVIAVVGIAWALISQSDTTVPPATVPTPTTTPTTQVLEDLESFRGYWAGSGIQLLMEGNLYDLLVNGEVVDRGTFSLLAVSERVIFSSNSDSLNCSDAAKGTYQYVFNGPDEFQLTFASDDCDLDRGFGQGMTLNRSEPFSVPDPASDEPEATGPELGPNGFEIFSGQTEPGRYETSTEDYDFSTVNFDSDGSWNCTTLPCSNGFGDRGVFEVSQREIAAAFLVLSESDRTAEQIIADLNSNPDVVVGDVSDFPAGSQAATWTASKFTLTPSESAPTNPNICGNVENLPCARTDLLNRLDTWNSQTAGGGGSTGGALPPDWVVTSQQSIWLITRRGGSAVVAAAYFASGYVPSEDEVSSLSQAADLLIASILFP